MRKEARLASSQCLSAVITVINLRLNVGPDQVSQALKPHPDTSKSPPEPEP